MATSKYYTLAEQAMKTLEDSIGVLIYNKNLLSDDDQEYGSQNIYDLITKADEAFRQLKVLDCVHEFMGTTKNIMDAQFTAVENGNRSGAYTILNYQKADYETPRSLEMKFGVPAQTILDFNHMTMDVFDRASIVQIPMPDTIAPANSVFVTGDQSGNGALGRDISNSGDFVDGDFEVLSPEDTLAQTVGNILGSERGDIPFYEKAGLPARAGSDLQDEELLPMIQQDIVTALDADSQTLSVDEVTVVRQGNGVSASVRMSVGGQTVVQNMPIGS